MKTPPIDRRSVTISLAALVATAVSASAYPIEVPNGDFEVDRDDRIGGLADGADVYIKPLLQSWYQYNVNTNGGTLRYWNPGDPNDPNAVGQARWADTGFGGIAPDGDHVGYTVTRYNDDKFPDGTSGAVGDYQRDFEAICQVLEDVSFDPNEEYTLTVEVGNPPGTPGDPDFGAKQYAYNGYMVQLLAGGEELNQGSAYAPTVLESSGGVVIAEDINGTAITVNTFETITVKYTPGDLTAQQEEDLAGLPIQIRLCALEGPDHSVLSLVAFDSVALDGPPPPPVVEIAKGETDYTLQWDSYAGRQYKVESSTDLSTWSPVLTGIATNPPTNTQAVAPSGDTLFYRVVGEPAP